MTAIDFALIVVWRSLNALLTTAIVLPLFVLLAIVVWPAYDTAGVGVNGIAFAVIVTATGANMPKTKPCTNEDQPCDGTMTHSDRVRYPGAAAIGRGLNEPLNLPAPTYGPGWQCEKCGHVEPD